MANGVLPSTQLDLQQYPPLNFVVEGSTTAPPHPIAGQLWRQTGADLVNVYGEDGLWHPFISMAQVQQALTDAGLATDEEMAAALVQVYDALSRHAADSHNVHGIPDTAVLITQSGLSITLNNYATQADISNFATHADVANAVHSHAAQTVEIHGIHDTHDLVTEDEIDLPDLTILFENALV